jgi:hypothetical protein
MDPHPAASPPTLQDEVHRSGQREVSRNSMDFRNLSCHLIVIPCACPQAFYPCKHTLGEPPINQLRKLHKK